VRGCGGVQGIANAAISKQVSFLRLGMCPVKCVNRLMRFRSSLLYLACYQLRLLLHLFLAWQFRQRARTEVTLRDLPLVVLL
jgi:hypothetical protein